MNRLTQTFALASATLAIMSTLTLSTSALASTSGWEEVMRNDKVTVYTRTHAGKPVKEIKATGIVDVPAWILKNVVDDVDGYTKLIPFTTTAKVVDTDGDKLVTFQRLEMPFTQAREYVVTCSDASYVKADGLMVYKSEWTTAAKRFQHHVSDNAVHVKLNDGSWTFEELADGRTRATFHLFVDPEGELPKALVNIAQRITVSQYLGNLERRASLPQYRTQRPAPSILAQRT